jgi:site-specific recombinase XerD
MSKHGGDLKKERQTLHVHEWAGADQLAWRNARRPSQRLKKGGAGSHLGPISLDDYARRYGQFLGYLKRKGLLDLNAPAAGLVTPVNVESYMAAFAGKVSSVTAWNRIYKLRRAAQLISPNTDFTWLTEIEKDLELLQEPKSKFDRLVTAEQLVEAGLTLIVEAKTLMQADFKRARGIRNGLMLALLALCPTRRKNFASLEVGKTFKLIHGRWWITLSSAATKMKKPEERPIAEWLNIYIGLYLNEARPILLGASRIPTSALWISSTGQPMTAQKVGSLITQITQQTIGVGISPHLFRTADATTAADARGDMPHLASALLGHSDTKITEEHYNRASSLESARRYANIIEHRYFSVGPTGS